MKAAYRALALRHHPDRKAGRPSADRFAAAAAAFEIIGRSDRRLAYDCENGHGGPHADAAVAAAADAATAAAASAAQQRRMYEGMTVHGLLEQLAQAAQVPLPLSPADALDAAPHSRGPDAAAR